jgi:hypothetical protein
MATGDIIASFEPYESRPTSTNYAWRDELTNLTPVLVYDASTLYTAVFARAMPSNYSGVTGITVLINWTSRTGTTGNVVWKVQFQRLVPGTTAIGTDTFDTADAQTVIAAAPGTAGLTAGIMVQSTITFTTSQAAAIVKGDIFLVSVIRDAANASDTMSGDALLQSIILKDT